MTDELPALTGPPKQIAWAAELRPVLAERVRQTKVAAQTAFDRKVMIAEKKGRPFFEPNGFRNDHGWTRDLADRCIQAVVDACDETLADPDAATWIDLHHSFDLVTFATIDLANSGAISLLQKQDFDGWTHDRLRELTAI